MKKHTIYFKVVSVDEQLPIELTVAQHRSCPNHEISMESYKETIVSATFSLVNEDHMPKMLELIKINIKKTHNKVITIDQLVNHTTIKS